MKRRTSRKASPMHVKPNRTPSILLVVERKVRSSLRQSIIMDDDDDDDDVGLSPPAVQPTPHDNLWNLVKGIGKSNLWNQELFGKIGATTKERGRPSAID